MSYTVGKPRISAFHLAGVHDRVFMYTNSGYVSLSVRMRAFQQYMTRHVIYRWKAQTLSFPFGRGTRSCIRVHGSGVLYYTLAITVASVPKINYIVPYYGEPEKLPNP